MKPRPLFSQPPSPCQPRLTERCNLEETSWSYAWTSLTASFKCGRVATEPQIKEFCLIIPALIVFLILTLSPLLMFLWAQLLQVKTWLDVSKFDCAIFVNMMYLCDDEKMMENVKILSLCVLSWPGWTGGSKASFI